MGRKFYSITEVRIEIEAAVEFYNTERLHMSIGMRTPVEALKCNGEIKKRWYNYRDEAIKRLVSTAIKTDN